jgi:competence protein ComEC
LALLLGLLSAWRGQAQISDYLTARQIWIMQHGARSLCSGTATIVVSPTVRRGTVVTIVDADSIECDSAVTRTRARLRFVSPPEVGLARGDRVQFTAELAPVSLIQNMGLMSPLPRVATSGVIASGATSVLDVIRPGRGPLAHIDRARNHVRSRITATYSPQAEALGRALVLGESDLAPDDDLAFRRSGLSHLLAVSGTHLVFAVIAWMTALRALLVRVTLISSRWQVERLVAPLGALSAVLYADFAGGSGSAWRAAWMLVALYTGRIVGRKVRALQALALSLIAGAAVEPWAGFDLSFLLSAAATLGLIAIGQWLAPQLRSVPWRPLRALCLAACTTICALVPCVPILSLMSPDLTLAGIFANLIAGPLGETASLPLCLVHAVASPWPLAERGLALCASGALLLVAKIAHFTADLSFARVSVPYAESAQFCLLVVGVLAMARCKAARGKCALVLVSLLTLCLVEVTANAIGKPRNKLRVTVNDVGQGDSLLVDFPDGRCMLIDGGGSITGGADPGLTILQPLLRARRRQRIDVVVVTHPHPDHFGGLLSLLPVTQVGEVWMQEGTLPELRSALEQRKVPILGLAQLCAGPRNFGAAELRVLGPCPQASETSSANNSSIVIQLRLGQRIALLPGDAEHEAEHDLIARYGAQLAADFLKVGHHGSRSSSSPEWLKAVQPKWAAVSAGSRNRFGHPVPAIEARLRESGAVVLRTDELGSIQWETDGSHVTLRTARAKLTVDGHR